MGIIIRLFGITTYIKKLAPSLCHRAGVMADVDDTREFNLLIIIEKIKKNKDTHRLKSSGNFSFENMN